MADGGTIKIRSGGDSIRDTSIAMQKKKKEKRQCYEVEIKTRREEKENEE